MTMNVSQIVKSLNDAAGEIDRTGISEDDRKNLMEACENLRSKLEQPFETTLRFMFSIYQTTALRVGINMGLFDAAAKSDASGMTVEELAATCNADPLLTLRFIRLLAGMGVFEERGHHRFAPTALAKYYVTGNPLTSAVIHLGGHMESFAKMPDYFEERKYQNPEDGYDGPFQYAIGKKEHYFDWLQSHPKDQVAFNTTMTIQLMQRGKEWFEFYPVAEKLRATADEVLLIDMGGGLGHDLTRFKSHLPDLPGKLLVQDLPVVIDDIKELPPGVEAMKHSFLDPQPVKGAKGYYLRTVLHDWPDKQARLILNHIKDAMNKDSILLINENILAEEKVPITSAMSDMVMMAVNGSLDRTEAQFRKLLDELGFDVLGIWKEKDASPRAPTLIEAKLKA